MIFKSRLLQLHLIIIVYDSIFKSSSRFHFHGELSVPLWALCASQHRRGLDWNPRLLEQVSEAQDRTRAPGADVQEAPHPSHVIRRYLGLR